MEKQDALCWKIVLSNSVSNGGLNFVDFATLDNTFKINWLRNYLNNPSSVWNIIPEYICSQLGGLNFLLLCGFRIEIFHVALSNFPKQALLAWSNTSFLHPITLSGIARIFVLNMSLFFENWFKNGINRVSQLFNQDGYLFTCQEFIYFYNIHVTPNSLLLYLALSLNVSLCYLIIFWHILKPRIGLSRPTYPTYPDPTDTYVGRICFKSAFKKK